MDGLAKVCFVETEKLSEYSPHLHIELRRNRLGDEILKEVHERLLERAGRRKEVKIQV